MTVDNREHGGTFLSRKQFTDKARAGNVMMNAAGTRNDLPRMGWYVHPRSQYHLAWWTGREWNLDMTCPRPVAWSPNITSPSTAVSGFASPVAPRPVKVRHVSGLTTGGHLVHFTLTVATLGLWAPVWALVAFLGRRRVR